VPLGIDELSQHEKLVALTANYEYTLLLHLQQGEDDGFNLIKLKPHKVDEKIFDIQQNKKIFVSELITKYLRGFEIKMVFSLNNKIVIQKDDDFKIFSLKNEGESERLVDCLSNLNS
jgi:hypothetical protein